jgi:hypothetical protein
VDAPNHRRRHFGTSRSFPSVRHGSTFHLRRNAIIPGTTWGVGHGSGDGLRFSMTVRAPRIPDPDHEPSNHGLSASRPGPRYGRAHPGSFIRAPSIALRVSGGRSSFDRAPEVRRHSPSGGAAASSDVVGGSSPPGDAFSIELGAHDPRRGDEIRVARDRRREPVDVRRFECGDLAERVSVELAEAELEIEGILERRRHRPAEVADPGARERPGGGARPRRLPERRCRAQRWLAADDRPPGGARRRMEGLVARPHVAGRVNSPGHRSGRLGLRGTAPLRGARAAAGVAGRAGIGRSDIGPRPALAEPPAVPGQGRLRVVDLGHPLGGDPRRRRIVSGQVRVMRPGEAPPRCLDLGRAGTRVDAEDDVGIACWHGSSLSVGRRCGGSLDRSAGRAVP